MTRAVAYGVANLFFGGIDAATVADVVHAAYEHGVRVFDTAPAYTPDPARPHLGESWLAEVLRRHGMAGDVVVSTKGGSRRTGSTTWELDGRPEQLRQACQGSLRALGVDAIDLYYLHWPDPAVPFEDSIGALAQLHADGLVGGIGLSNVTVEQVHAAEALTPVAAVQNPFGLHVTSDDRTMAHCRDAGVAFYAYSPLGGVGGLGRLVETHPGLVEVAEARGVSVAQVVLAWHFAQGPTVVPLVGATRVATVVDAARAVDVVLSTEELDALAR